MSFSSEILEEIRHRLSIVDLISESVKLKRSGRGFTGLCPFHNEKTPSFSVRDEEGNFHCFGCGKHGSIFDYIMLTRGLSFPEAVRFLANRAGIEIPESGESKGEYKAQSDRQKLYRAVARALSDLCFASLWGDALPPSAKRALTYLESRGLNADVSKLFQLGYCPFAGHELLERVAKMLNTSGKDFAHDQPVLLETLRTMGIIKVRSEIQPGTSPERQIYSPFSGRLIFPVTRSDGAVLGFSARLLEQAENKPKYINSSENPIYQKRRMFFGLSQAMQAIRNAHSLYLVEGNLDVMSMYQFGFCNTVATCGTAISAEHVQTLARLANKVVVVFDGDSAGRVAASKCFELFLGTGVEVSVVKLPDGEDPNSFLKSKGRDALDEIIKQTGRPAVESFLERLIESEGGNPIRPEESPPEVLGRTSRKFVQVVNKLKNSVERELLFRIAAGRLGVSIESVQSMAKEGESADNAKLEIKAETIRNREYAENSYNSADSRKYSKQNGQAGDWKSEWKGKKFNNNRGGQGNEQSPLLVASKPPNGTIAKDPELEFYRQIVVAVLCEPSLARTLLELPSLWGETPVISDFPEYVCKFVKLASDSEIHYEILPEMELEEIVQALEGYRSFLDSCQLPSQSLIDEAARQLTIGGGRPKELVMSSPLSSVRRSLGDQVQKLRADELSSDHDPEKLAGMVQEKLLKRRNYEQLVRSNRTRTDAE